MKRLLPLLAIALVAFVLTAFRLDTATRDTGPGREARLNPWLAAGRLLERQHLTVRFSPEYGGLPAHAAVLILATPLDSLDAKEQMALIDWVRRGGHLITALKEVSSGNAAPTEGLARRFDVRLRERRFDSRKEGPKENSRPVGKDGHTVHLGDNEQAEVNFDASLSLESGKFHPDWTVTDDAGIHLMRIPLGNGHVTLASDLRWLENARIGKGDHALLLWRMVDAGAPAEVWLFHGIGRPSLLSILWTHAAPLLVGAALLVLVWLWRVTGRFGPTIAPVPPARRKLSEHLTASGLYFMRHGGTGQLYDASRQRLLAQVQRRHPQWRHLSLPALAEQIARRAGLEAGAVQRVLEGEPPLHPLQFAADIRLVNRLRKAL